MDKKHIIIMFILMIYMFAFFYMPDCYNANEFDSFAIESSEYTECTRNNIIYHLYSDHAVVYSAEIDISKAEIPETITAIDKNVFDLPVTEIARRAFSGCWYLKILSIPEGITQIGDMAFNNCIALKSVTIPDGVISIGRMAFLNCIEMENVYIPDTVEEIGERAFYGNTELKEISIPAHLTETVLNNNVVSRAEKVVVRGNEREKLEYNISNNKDGLCNLATNKSVVLDNIYDSTFNVAPNQIGRNVFLQNYNNGFRSTDLLHEVIDKDGNIFAVYGKNDYVTIIPENSKFKTLKIENTGFIYGAAEIGDDNYIYIIWGKELTKDEINNYPQTENIIICKYDMNGKQVDYLGLPIEKTLAQSPFSGGNANIEYKNGVLGVLYDTEWINGHQGSEFAAINASDMTLIDFSDYEGSHSLGVSMIKTDFGLAAIQMGDADESRGINMNRYYINDDGEFSFGSHEDLLVHSSGKYEQMGFLNQNNTFLHMGGVAISKSTYAIVGKAEKDYTSDLSINSDVHTKKYDVFVRIIDKTLASVSDLNAGVDRIDAVDGSVADSNMIWLMEYNEVEKAGNVKVVTLESGAYCVLWEKFINDEFDSIRYVIIDEVGNILRNETGIYNARLSDTSIQPIVNDMTLVWAIADKEKSSIIWYSVNLDELVSQKVIGDANLDGKVTVADAVMLQKWLLGASTEMTCWQNVDLCEDGRIDVFDLCLLKRLLLQK